MLSFEHDYELFHLLCVPYQQQQQQQQQQQHNIPFPPPQSSSRLITTQIPPKAAESTKPKSSRKRKSSVSCSHGSIQDNESPEDYGKRIIHRDVERQRRQEMSSLYKSLKSLVPHEYLQQKRSISDHMHGTEKYIRHLKEKVDELMNKRDELQNLMNLGHSNTSSYVGSEFSVSQDERNIIVQRSATGIQVILKTSLKTGLPLSKFLIALNDEGMAVVSCISTKANEGQIHVIEAEMDEGRNVDQIKLQKRLRDLLYNL